MVYSDGAGTLHRRVSAAVEFDLRHTAIPTLELKFDKPDDATGTVQYRWLADEKAFAMPVRAR